jgi:type II secretory ATPase GspE/PulE/Tfp pilus assembly ATPase PilB-like protein
MPATVRRGAGCDTCAGTGYRGRAAIAELLTMTEALREALTHGAPIGTLRELAQAAGGASLLSDGRRAVCDGVTTAAEVTRVLGEERW